MKTFLKPLTTQEETFYLRKCRQGDKAARDVLIERNLRLVAHIVKKYQGVDEDLDDLISIGTIGLIKAVSTYDMEKGSRLATYAARCIDNELLMMLRSRKKFSREVSLYEPIGTDKEGNEISLIDIIEYEDEDIPERITREQHLQKLRGFMDEVLTDREREILTLRYGLDGKEEKTQREVAKIYGISRSYVSRIEKKALLKLNKCYQNLQKHIPLYLSYFLFQYPCLNQLHTFSCFRLSS